VFWVVFMWGFFDNGPLRLGVNAGIFLLLVLGFLGNVFPQERPLWSMRHWPWLVPFLVIAASYALYATPVTKAISIPVVPALLVVFVTYALLSDRSAAWGWGFLQALVLRGFAWLGKVSAAIREYSRALFGKGSSNTAWRAIAGVVLLVVIVVTVILPLLSSADPQFKTLVQPVLDFLGRLVEVETLWRVVVGAVIALFSLSLGLAWRTRPEVRESGSRAGSVDAIVSGIVVGGIFLVYALFLVIQIKRLWVAELPIDFSQTEELVKSGFWQLFALSIINGLVFLATYQKTNPLVQRLLAAFAAASLLLVFSAGWRMALYVVFYGFSYEKFFAAYTVIFSIILFTWLVFQFFGNKRRDLVKFVSFLFLWMYAALCLFPIEQFIMRANLALSERPDSRIENYEMTMLSTDVLGYVEERRDDPRFAEWGEWIERNQEQVAKKAWYELTVSDIAYKAGR
ncbi:MAG: DUF4173 domain-containing protein, partial [bacterium]|nr:DUF4173 domain-containing protein [bacterium]